MTKEAPRWDWNDEQYGDAHDELRKMFNDPDWIAKLPKSPTPTPSGSNRRDS